MASPQVQSLDWGDVVTTTLENRSKSLADNITNNNALLARLKKTSSPFDGGREIIQELAYAQNQTFLWYSGAEPLNIALNDTMTAARFPIKQSAISVVITGLEQIQNSGEEAMMNLLEQREAIAEDTFENQMSAGVYSDGTAFGGKQIGGLALLISKAPTSGIVGGIDAGAQVWWRNLAFNSATDAVGALTTPSTAPGLMQQYFNKICLSAKRNSQGIDMVVADTNYYSFFAQSLQALQRITDSGNSSQGLGFTSLKYYGAGMSVDIILDGGKGGQIPTNTAYFINSKYIHYKPFSKRNFKVIGGDRVNVNQDAIVRIMAWAGNMTTNNRSLQAVLF
jgi:hypothetical protein